MLPGKMKVIGFWLSRKKSQKLNWREFLNVCETYGYELKEVNLEQSLESQGPFTIFLHKLTDIIALSIEGHKESKIILERVEKYVHDNPSMLVLDPLDSVHVLLNRFKSYNIIRDCSLDKCGVFTPDFVKLSCDLETNKKALRDAGLRYPLVCKSLVAHGSQKAHRMCIVFNEEGLADCETPCVAQKFVNHNARLYKVFLVGNRFYVVERPSLKNFKASEKRDTLWFDSADVSKAASQSSLCVLDPEDRSIPSIEPTTDRIYDMVVELRQVLKMALLGIDVVIENNTGKYGIIDINAFPGYDGYPDFFTDLMICIQELFPENKPNDSKSVTGSGDYDAERNNYSTVPLLNRKHIIKPSD